MVTVAGRTDVASGIDGQVAERTDGPTALDHLQGALSQRPDLGDGRDQPSCAELGVVVLGQLFELDGLLQLGGLVISLHQWQAPALL
jgi:hypothetical protein